MSEDDRGQRVAYQGLNEGARVYESGGSHVGKLHKILAVEEEDVFDGLIVYTDDSLTEQRFVDADMIGDLYENRIELKITEAQLHQQPEHERGFYYEPRAERGRLAHIWRVITLRSGWRRDKGPGPG